MRKNCVAGVAVACVVGVVGLVGVLRAEEATPPKYAYIGVKGCAMCHKTKNQGEQTAIWEGTKHAKAFETLKSDEARKVATERGLKKPASESPECLRCHVTGWNLSEEQRAQFLKPAFKIEDGVQCETCHGPGDKYKSLNVMKNREDAIKNGLVLGDEKLCLTCHNDQAPTWKPDRITTKDGRKVGFDFETYWEKIKHPVPKQG